MESVSEARPILSARELMKEEEAVESGEPIERLNSAGFERVWHGSVRAVNMWREEGAFEVVDMEVVSEKCWDESICGLVEGY